MYFKNVLSIGICLTFLLNEDGARGDPEKRNHEKNFSRFSISTNFFSLAARPPFANKKDVAQVWTHVEYLGGKCHDFPRKNSKYLAFRHFMICQS